MKESPKRVSGRVMKYFLSKERRQFLTETVKHM